MCRKMLCLARNPVWKSNKLDVDIFVLGERKLNAETRLYFAWESRTLLGDFLRSLFNVRVKCLSSIKLVCASCEANNITNQRGDKTCVR